MDVGKKRSQKTPLHAHHLWHNTTDDLIVDIGCIDALFLVHAIITEQLCTEVECNVVSVCVYTWGGGVGGGKDGVERGRGGGRKREKGRAGGRERGEE